MYLKNSVMRFYILFLFVLILSGVFGQTIDYSNTRPGEDVEYCTTHKKLQELLQNPEYRKQFEEEQTQFRIEESRYKSSGRKRGTVYPIPVVFHVLHSGGLENISDEQIFDALAILNRDFRLQNLDSKSVHPDFSSLPTDVEIEFKMATIAPNGTCFKGITRTFTTDITTEGSKQVEIIRNGNDVYKGEWTGNNYMHIFICKSVGGAAGYTYRPFGNGNSMTNGIWILHTYVGSIGTSNTTKSRALTHEVGHWLNLMHTWGPNNNPGNSASCNDPNQDEVNDTPPTMGVTSCKLDEKSCGPRANVENYMDYSYCNKMFTPDQVTRMRTALLSNIGGRKFISSESNLIKVGVLNPALCKVDFRCDMSTICSGEEVSFFDLSYSNPITWNWSFEGGIPEKSTLQNPKVIFSKPGFYKVSLTASNANSTLTTIKDSFIFVLDKNLRIPSLETFNYSKTNVISSWYVNNYQNNNKFEIYNGLGYNDNNCLYLKNFGETGFNLDEIIFGVYDLSQVKSSKDVTFQFRYANARTNLTSNELLIVSISNDCGKTWTMLDYLTTSSISSTISDTEWYPSSGDWRTFTLTDIPSQFLTDDCRIKIEFKGNLGNNFFIDDVNIYPSAPSDEIVASIKNVNNLKGENISLTYNSLDNLLIVNLHENSSKKIAINISDISGKIIFKKNFLEDEISNKIEIDAKQITNGAYIVKIESDEGHISKYFVIE